MRTNLIDTQHITTGTRIAGDMKIPRKISPDRIKDALVEIRYFTSLPPEVVVGIFYDGLDDTYTYTNRPLNRGSRPPAVPQLPPGVPIELVLGGQSIFYTDKISIQVRPGSLMFNVVNEYIGWDAYREEIRKVIDQLEATEVIESYTRVGIRYISEYPNQDLNSCVKFSFTFGMPQIKSEKYAFQSEFRFEKMRVILNLKHQQPVMGAKANEQPSFASTIDIDTIMDDFQLSSVDELFAKIDEVHSREKEVFFNLLNEEFLKTLNPEY